MSCPICTHNLEHGWYGPDFAGERCRDCHRSWTGLAECHCAGCHQHFGSDSAFDLHQVGDEVICRDPATLIDRHGAPRLKVVERKSVGIAGCTRPPNRLGSRLAKCTELKKTEPPRGRTTNPKPAVNPLVRQLHSWADPVQMENLKLPQFSRHSLIGRFAS